MKIKTLSLLTLIIFTTQTHALSWQDLWKNKNQRGKEMLRNSAYKEAQQTFTDPNWQAVAAYRAGNYQLAADLLSKAKTPYAEYNLGNALAKLGRYQEAIAAYDKAIAKNNKNQDAEYNRDLVKKLLEKQKQQQQPQQESPKDGQQNPQQGDKSDPNANKKENEQQKQGNNDSQQNQNKEQDKKSQKDKEPKQDKPKPPKDQAKPQTAKPDEKSGGSKQQMKDQWLKLIPDDPGGLLREKFRRDYLRRRGEA